MVKYKENLIGGYLILILFGMGSYLFGFRMGDAMSGSKLWETIIGIILMLIGILILPIFFKEEDN